MVLKAMKINGKDNKMAVYREYYFGKLVAHPNVVQTLAFCEDQVLKDENGNKINFGPYLILELINGGTLLDHINVAPFEEKEARTIFG